MGNAIHNAGSNAASILAAFFVRIADDPRIGVTHIALYTAMVYHSGDEFFLKSYGKELREIAKINSSRTYHKALRDLTECGYIHYERATSRWEKSIIHFIAWK